MALKIALVSREYPPGSGGGIGAYAARIAPALAREGCRVHVVTQPHEGRPSCEAHGPITVHRVAMGDGSGRGVLRGALEAGRVVAALAERGAVDVAEFADFEGAGFALEMARGRRGVELPVVVHLHSPTELNLALNGASDGALPRHLAMVIAAERWAITTADALCAPSRFMATWARSHYDLPEAPVVIPYALDASSDTSSDTSSRARQGRRLLYVGRLERRKGVDLLIRAWARVAADHPEWELRLVGDDTGTAPGGGSMRAHLASLLPDRLAARTTFTGPRSPEALQAEYDAALLSIVPSRWENFPNTCIEAMASGRAVIVSDHGGMREMLGTSDAGAIFRSGDVDDLAATLGAVLATPVGRLLAQGTAAHAAIAALCDPVRVARERIAFYRSAIDVRRQAPRPTRQEARGEGRTKRRLDLWRLAQSGAAPHLPALAPAIGAWTGEETP